MHPHHFCSLVPQLCFTNLKTPVLAPFISNKLHFQSDVNLVLLPSRQPIRFQCWKQTMFHALVFAQGGKDEKTRNHLAQTIEGSITVIVRRFARNKQKKLIPQLHLDLFTSCKGNVFRSSHITICCYQSGTHSPHIYVFHVVFPHFFYVFFFFFFLFVYEVYC